jgi:hypothetical protein
VAYALEEEEEEEYLEVLRVAKARTSFKYILEK